MAVPSGLPVVTVSNEHYQSWYCPINPMVSPEFMAKSFNNDRALIESNQWRILGRQVTAYLETKTIGQRQARDCLGIFLPIIGHIFEASILNAFNTEFGFTSSKPYVKTVAEVTLSMFKYKTDASAIACPNGKPATPVPFLSPSDSNTKNVPAALSLLKSLLQMQVVTRNDTISGTALVALGQTEHIAGLKKVLMDVDERRLLSPKANLRWILGAGIMILDGAEVKEWIEKQDKSKAPHAYLDEVTKRMDDINLGFLDAFSDEVSLEFVQELSRTIAVVKVKVISSRVNAIRNAICPGIQEKQFSALSLFGIDCVPLNPVDYNSDDFYKYMEVVQQNLNNPALNAVMELMRTGSVGNELEPLKDYISKL